MLTDVVMPGMDGTRLARAAKELREGLRVLYMSGYTRDGIVKNGVLAEGIQYLAKPFTPEGLYQKVRETLDAQ
jgi:CheY-like chemotaxis protein